MDKKLICIVGDYGDGALVSNGQTAKVRDYYYYLSKRYGANNVILFSTTGWKKNFIKKTIELVKCLFKSNFLILILAQNGRKTILPFATYLKPLTKNKILFSCVGGSLMYEIDNEKRTIKSMRKIEAIFTETRTFKEFLELQQFNNVYYAPVFSKRRKTIDKNILEAACQVPIRFCTYSRVCKEKGISEAIEAVAEVNMLLGANTCILDIYGEPSDDYKNEFDELLKTHSGYVFKYPYLTDENALDELSKHYAMIFPTFYSGEGFPIAIIECYMAGVPVVASDWHFNSEIVLQNKTGFLFNVHDKEKLVNYLIDMINDKENVLRMKAACVVHSRCFYADEALKDVYKIVDEGI